MAALAETRIGHNAGPSSVSVRIKAFNSLVGYCDPGRLQEPFVYPAASTVADIVRDLAIPLDKLFLVLINGRDVSPGLVGQVNLDRVLEDGDVVALSGPVPFSFGYGAPVV